jgi:hypothetical protein
MSTPVEVSGRTRYLKTAQLPELPWAPASL